MKYGNRPSRFNFFNSSIAIIILIVVVVLLAKATWGIHQKTALGADKLDQAKAELARLESRKSSLAEEVTYLSTEQGVESELRTKYRAVKEGESVAVILDNDKTAAVIEASTTPVVGPNLSWWGRLLQFVGL